ncbi:hypothetical protein ACFQFH_06515 [Halobaculum halobium]
MDLDELRSVQSKERTKDSLQHLRDSFYEDVAAYLAERKRQRDERAAGVDNPFSDQQVRKLSDEIETAEEVVESLYERRVGKVVKLSSFAAAGAPTDTEGMTVQEVELFEDLVVRIEQNKNRVLNVLETGADVAIDADSGAAGAVSTEPSAGSDAPPAAVAEASTPDSAGAKEPTDGPEDDASGVLADAMGGDGAPRTVPQAERPQRRGPRTVPTGTRTPILTPTLRPPSMRTPTRKPAPTQNPPPTPRPGTTVRPESLSRARNPIGRAVQSSSQPAPMSPQPPPPQTPLQNPPAPPPPPSLPPPPSRRPGAIRPSQPTAQTAEPSESPVTWDRSWASTSASTSSRATTW